MNSASLALRLSAKKAKAVWQAACSGRKPYACSPEERAAQNDLVLLTHAAWQIEQKALEAVLTPQEKKLDQLTYDFSYHFEQIPRTLRENKGRFLFRNLKKNGSDLEREVLKFVKKTIREYDAWDSFADGFENFWLGFTEKDFHGIIKIPLDKVRTFVVQVFQDYELEAIGARLRGAEIHENESIQEYYAEDVFQHLNEEKFKALYGKKIDGCDHGALAELPPDKVQECLNVIVGAPAKIFDQHKCGMCLEQVRLFALPCGHGILCQGCVGPYVRSNQKKCPVCRKGFALAKCCQAGDYEFTEEGLEALLEAEDDRGIWECLDFTSFAQAISGTDELIEIGQKSFKNYE